MKPTSRRLVGSEGKTPEEIWKEYREDLDRMLDRALGSTARLNSSTGLKDLPEKEKPPPG